MKDEYILSGHTLKILLALSFILLALVLWRSLRRLQTTSGNGYDWQDLLMENGRPSRAAHLMWGSAVVMTWYFIYAALTDKMSDTLYATYGGLCLAPTIARLIWNPSTPAPQSAAQTTTTTTTETK